MKSLLMMPISFARLILQSVQLAMGQILANKVRSFLTTLGIIIGIASVTAVIAALTGLKTKVMSDFETFGSNRIFIWAQQPDMGPMKHASSRVIKFKPEQFQGLLDYCPSVKNFSCVSHYNGAVRYGQHSIENASIKGIGDKWVDIESREILQGRPFSAMDLSQCRRVCLVDPLTRDKLQLDKECVGQFISIDNINHMIIGVIEKEPSSSFGGMGRGEGLKVFIPFTNHWRAEQPWFNVVASSKSADVSEEAKAELRFFIRKSSGLTPGNPDTFRIHAIDSEIRTIKDAMASITAVASGIVGISLLVGGIGIMNIMLVSVSERTREIGLRKAVGAKSYEILTQFLVEAIVLCCVGGLLGLGLGHLITQMIKQIPNARLDQAFIPGWAIIIAFCFSAGVGIFFGLFPALKAAKLDPIEALRHE